MFNVSTFNTLFQFIITLWVQIPLKKKKKTLHNTPVNEVEVCMCVCPMRDRERQLYNTEFQSSHLIGQWRSMSAVFLFESLHFKVFTTFQTRLVKHKVKEL